MARASSGGAADSGVELIPGEPLALHTGGRHSIILPRFLTLADVAEILQQLEEQDCHREARDFARDLDYDEVTALAKKGVAPDARPLDKKRNDPNEVPHRLVLAKYMLLFGMDDAKLGRPGKDRRPRVIEMQEALLSLGEDIPRTGVFDDDTLTAYLAWVRGEGAEARVELELDGEVLQGDRQQSGAPDA